MLLPTFLPAFLFPPLAPKLSAAVIAPSFTSLSSSSMRLPEASNWPSPQRSSTDSRQAQRPRVRSSATMAAAAAAAAAAGEAEAAAASVREGKEEARTPRVTACRRSISTTARVLASSQHADEEEEDEDDEDGECSGGGG